MISLHAAHLPQSPSAMPTCFCATASRGFFSFRNQAIARGLSSLAPAAATNSAISAESITRPAEAAARARDRDGARDATAGEEIGDEDDGAERGRFHLRPRPAGEGERGDDRAVVPKRERGAGDGFEEKNHRLRRACGHGPGV